MFWLIGVSFFRIDILLKLAHFILWLHFNLNLKVLGNIDYTQGTKLKKKFYKSFSSQNSCFYTTTRTKLIFWHFNSSIKISSFFESIKWYSWEFIKTFLTHFHILYLNTNWCFIVYLEFSGETKKSSTINPNYSIPS